MSQELTFAALNLAVQAFIRARLQNIALRDKFSRRTTAWCS
jgi:hypothetical protein